MKPLIVFSDVTIDGFMAGPDNDLDFMVDDPQLEDELTGMLMSVADTIVVGRKAFPDMAAHWTTADGDLAAWMNGHRRSCCQQTAAMTSAPGKTRHWPPETEWTKFAA
jgi:hypothetical protein